METTPEERLRNEPRRRSRLHRAGPAIAAVAAVALLAAACSGGAPSAVDHAELYDIYYSAITVNHRAGSINHHAKLINLESAPRCQQPTRAGNSRVGVAARRAGASLKRTPRA